MALPNARPVRLLVETFPRANRHYLVCYPFEGRLAHQTLGMLLRDALNERGCGPWVSSPTNTHLRFGARRRQPAHRARGFVTRRAVCEDMLGDDLEAWLAELALMKRTFRNCAIIAGLIERRFPGRRIPAAGDDLNRPRL